MGWQAFTSLLLLLATSAYCFPPYEDPNLFEGDMILDPDQLESIRNGEYNKAVPLAATRTKLWPRHIPYDLHDLKWDGAGRHAVETAIKEFEKKTCIRFKKRTTETGGYMKFFNGRSCSTQVGYIEKYYRRITLGPSCREPKIALHEMMHALGFHHEQTRPDRDNHVTIKYNNINSGLWPQFNKRNSSEVDSLGSPYDYYSIMHYRKTAFSKNGRVTIETSDPTMADVIGQQEHLSKEDIYQINKLYKCDVPLPTTVPPPTLPPDANCKDIYNLCDRHKSKCTLPKDDVWFKWVSKECRKTCGFCRPADEVAADVVADETLFSDDQCVDRYAHCDRHLDKCNKPKTDVWFDWVSKECTKTCKLCGQVTKPPPTQAPTKPIQTAKPICGDSLTNCDSYADQCVNGNDRMKQFLKTYCKHTCGYCGTAPITSTPGCFDLADCAGYVVRGYCKPAAVKHFHEFMKINCIKSCGWCGKQPTVAPPKGTQPPLPTNCGVSAVATSRVIGGTTAIPGAWPWIARLYKRNTRISYCGGALVSPTWVVTAAHCVHKRSSLEVEVQLGRHSLVEGTHREKTIQTFGARRVIVHPSYLRGSVHNNDVALIELEKPALLNDRVKTICLPKQSHDVPIGKECFIAGWGKTKFPQDGGPLTLQQTTLQIVGNQQCHALNYKKIGIPITKNMVCAGLGVNRIQSGCHGDSGGPLMCKSNGRFVLHGDVSWGSPTCSTKEGFSVFGRMSEFRSWINQHISS